MKKAMSNRECGRGITSGNLSVLLATPGFLLPLLACGQVTSQSPQTTAHYKWGEPFEVVQALWDAAAAEDSAAVSALAVSPGLQIWVEERSAAHPDFFAQTVERLELRGGYVFDDTGTVVVAFLLPYHTCPRPTRSEGEVWQAKVRRTPAGWRVLEVWRDIC